MKVMFISDIHGSYYWANKAIEKYHEEKADKLVILGDILYHGPRNDLPKDYNCKKVIALLNENDILIYGHFHKPLAKKENGIYILNPSSISLPKEGTNSYGIYENDCFTIKTFDDEIVKQIQLD